MRTLSVLNKLFTTAIIFTMINLNIAINIEQARFNITAAQAYAENTTSEEETSPTAGSNETPEVRSEDGTVVLENTQDSDTDSMTQKRQKMSGTYNKKESSGFLSIFGNGVVAPIILAVIAYTISKVWTFFKPTRPWDINAAALGAGILLVNELMSAFKQTESLKDRKDKIQYEGLGEDGQVDVSQKRLLEEEKAALEELKGTAESKAKFQLAASGVFFIASLLAVKRGMFRGGLAASCTSAINAYSSAIVAAKAPLVACFPATGSAAAAAVASCGKATVDVATMEGILKTAGDSRLTYKALMTTLKTEVAELKLCQSKFDSAYATTMSTGCAGEPTTMAARAKAAAAAGKAVIALQAPMESACTFYAKETVENTGEAEPELSSTMNNTSKFPLLKYVLNLVVGNAHAAGMGGSMGILIGLIGAWILPTAQWINQWIMSPDIRSVMWLTFGGVSLMTSEATKKEAEAIQDNIDKIDSILKKFRSAESVTSVESKTLQKKASALTRYQAQELGTEVECIGGLPKISTNNGSKACPSAEKYLVKSMGDLSSSGFSIPSGLTGSLVNAANGIQDTSSISPSTQESFDVIGNSTNALGKQAQKAVKKLLESNLKNKKKGKKTNDLLSAFGKGFNNLNKKAGGSGGLMSALPYLSNPANSNSGDDEGDEVAGQQDGLAATTDGGSGIGAIKTPKSNGFKFNFGQDDADAYAAQKHAEFDATADAVADMEDSGEGEIIEDKNVDIWKVISVRYKKTAYDRLLKRIE